MRAVNASQTRGAFPRCHRACVLETNECLALRDACLCSCAGSRESLPCGIWLKPDDASAREPAAAADGNEGGWGMEVHSRYLAGLPQSCGGCHEAASIALDDAHITRTTQGLHLQYHLAAGEQSSAAGMQCQHRGMSANRAHWQSMCQ